MGACSGWFVSVMTLFCLVHVPSGSTASKILLLGHGFPSQLFIVHEIGAELSRRGHEVVTVLGSHMKDQPIPLEGGNIVWSVQCHIVVSIHPPPHPPTPTHTHRQTDRSTYTTLIM